MGNSRTTVSLVSEEKRTPQDQSSKVAAFLLSLLVLAICIGPRLRIGGEADRIDIRYQDLLLIPIIIYLLLSKKPVVRVPMQKLFGMWLPFFLWGAVVVTALVCMLVPEVSLFRRVAFLGRGLELFVLAAAVAGLYLRSGSFALRALMRAVHIAAYANIAWVGYQLLTGSTGTLLGSAVGSSIEAYGPKLIGEGSAFGTGQFFALVACVGVAEFRSRATSKLWALALIAVDFGGAYLSQSRISIGVVLLAICILLTISSRKRRLVNIEGVLFFGVLAFVAAVFVIPQLQGRQSIDGIESGLNVRIDLIWGPLLDVLKNHPFTGAGVGGLTGGLPIEAHNIYLRAVLDFGLIFGVILIGMLLSVMRESFKASKLDKSAEWKFAANLVFLGILSVLVSGFVQDSLTGVMSSHLAMLTVGVFAAVRAKSNDVDEIERVSAESAVRRKPLAYTFGS